MLVKVVASSCITKIHRVFCIWLKMVKKEMKDFFFCFLGMIL